MDKSTLVTEAPPVLAISAAKGAKALKVDELPHDTQENKCGEEGHYH